MKRQVFLVLLAGFLTCAPAVAQQRSGGRGASPAPGGAYVDTLNAYRYAFGQNLVPWWTNASVVTRLGITEEQKAQIERIFENHRLNLETTKVALEKEETQLAQLLNTEPFDRDAALTQTNRVIQARSDLERENSIMTLEMREHLTRAQWTQLPQPSVGVTWTTKPGLRFRWQEGGGGRGARGQQ